MTRLWVSLLNSAARQNFLIAITASLSAMSAYVLYHHHINITLGVVVLLATFFTYTMQRLFGFETSITEIPRWKLLLLGFSGILILIFAFFLTLTQVVLLGVAGALSVLYAYPAFPFKNTRKSLRQIPYLKIWVILAVWIIVICLAPLSDLSPAESGALTMSRIVFIIQQGTFIFALTIPFDIRDLEVDGDEQRTIPMILGIESSIKLAKSALWISFFAVGMNFLLGFFDLEIVFIQLFIVILGLKLLHRARTIRSSEFYLVQIDGLIALQAILFLLSYFI
jgi:hypothetical protein